MYLVISEKPSVAQSIGKVLGAYKKEQGYLSGRDCIISWCLGHLAEYAMPESYDEAYKKWSFEDLPILPEKWKLELDPDKKKQFTVLKKLLSRTDLDYVVNACDAGREGELIFKRVYDLSESRIPVKRLWISSMEDTAVKEGFDHLESGAAYQNLADASVCRAQADWLIGINATRAYTTTYFHRLIVGRVQTPTLAMIVKRDQEIADFQKEQYFVTHLLSEELDAVSMHFKDQEEAEALADKCRGKEAVVCSVKKEEKSVPAPKLFDLTSLQREANRMFGYTAKQTLEAAQSLYEKKLMTYPRTDSRYLTEDMEETVIKVSEVLTGILPYLPVGEELLAWRNLFNNKEVTDHHAIIPTLEIAEADFQELPEMEKRILGMVASRLMEAAMPKQIYLSVKAEIKCEGDLFTASGRQVLDWGWKVADKALREFLRAEDEKETAADSAEFPELKEGQTLRGVSTKMTRHWTKPPAHYTEDSLLSAMEQAGRKELEEGVERKGLGTPATRASIIEKLISSGYAVRKKKQILATEAGIEMISLMPEYLVSAKMTADWENRLLAMERGEEQADVFMEDIVHLLHEMLTQCKVIPAKERQKFAETSRREIGRCPMCGSSVYEGKSNYYCSSRTCSFALWKENRYLTSMKKNISRKMAEELLKRGRSYGKDFYSAKTGKMFAADLIMDVAPDGRVSFRMEFPQSDKRKRE